MAATFEELLERRIGDLGLWHVCLMATLLPSTVVLLEFFAQFAFLLPRHHCRQPNLTALGWQHHSILNLTVPRKPDPHQPPAIGQPFEPCLEFADLDALWPHLGPNTSLEAALELRDRLVGGANLTAGGTRTRACTHGVEFEPGTGPARGIVFGAEFSAVCGRRFLIPLSNSAYVVGLLLGFLAAGPLADRFGRRRVCLVAPWGHIVTGLGTAAAQSVWLAVVLRVGTAAAAATSFVTGMTLVYEWLTAGQRLKYAVVRQCYMSFLARGFLVLVFWAMPSWRAAYALYFVLTTPVLLGPMVWLESPRWLLARGRTEEALALMLSVRRWNRRPVYPDEVDVMREELRRVATVMQSPCGRGQSRSPQSSCAGDLQRLLRDNCLRRRLLLLLSMWCGHTMIYYGLNYNAVRLGSDPFLVALAASLMPLPANALLFLSFTLSDRRRPMIACYLLCGLLLAAAFVLMAFVDGGRGLPVTVVSTAGLFAADALFSMLYIRTPELFPTGVRLTAFGLCTGVARFGMMAATVVERLDEMVWVPLPLLIFATTAMAAGLASFFLKGGQGEMEEWGQTSHSKEDEEAMKEEEGEEDAVHNGLMDHQKSRQVC